MKERQCGITHCVHITNRLTDIQLRTYTRRKRRSTEERSCNLQF